MYQMMLNRKNSKKGFTLVEVIVVLVILAILAAIMIPAMTGWIDEANKKKVYVEARSALLAAQTVESERYGEGGYTAKATLSAPEAGWDTLAGVDGDIKIITTIKAQITSATYTPDGGTAVYYDGTSWGDTAPVAPAPGN